MRVVGRFTLTNLEAFLCGERERRTEIRASSKQQSWLKGFPLTRSILYSATRLELEVDQRSDTLGNPRADSGIPALLSAGIIFGWVVYLFEPEDEHVES